MFVDRAASEADYWAAVDAFERFTGQVVRHSDHEHSDRVRTGRKDNRGRDIRKRVSRG